MDGNGGRGRWSDWGGGQTLALLAGLLGVGAPAEAQTRFEWDSVPDVNRYTVFEECLTALTRVSEREIPNDKLDTTENAGLEYWRQPPEQGPSALTRATARQCLARFTPADSTLDIFELTIVMAKFLEAERDADAEAVLARRLAAVPATDTATLAAIKDSALESYQRARPYRRVAVEQLLSEKAEREHWDTRTRLWSRMELAGNAKDTVLYKAVAKQYYAGSWLDTLKATYEPHFAQAATDSTARWWTAHRLFGQAYQVYQDSLLDTLKLGTVRWKEAKRALMVRVSTPERAALVNFDSLTGKPAPAVVGDFWFGYDTTAAPRPTRGKVGLVVFVEGMGSPRQQAAVGGDMVDRCVWSIPDRETLGVVTDECWPQLVVVRRLMRRFPALEVTLIAATTGSTLYRGLPDSAAVEAAMIRRLVLDGHQMPPGAALVVSQSKFFRLPAPDRRLIRVRSSDRNVAQYEQLAPAGSGMAYLVDRDGLVVDAMRVKRDTEPMLRDLINAVLQQPTSHP